MAGSKQRQLPVPRLRIWSTTSGGSRPPSSTLSSTWRTCSRAEQQEGLFQQEWLGHLRALDVAAAGIRRLPHASPRGPSLVPLAAAAPTPLPHPATICRRCPRARTHPAVTRTRPHPGAGVPAARRLPSKVLERLLRRGGGGMWHVALLAAGQACGTDPAGVWGGGGAVHTCQHAQAHAPAERPAAGEARVRRPRRMPRHSCGPPARGGAAQQQGMSPGEGLRLLPKQGTLRHPSGQHGHAQAGPSTRGATRHWRLPRSQPARITPATAAGPRPRRRCRQSARRLRPRGREGGGIGSHAGPRCTTPSSAMAALVRRRAAQSSEERGRAGWPACLPACRQPLPACRQPLPAPIRACLKSCLHRGQRQGSRGRKLACRARSTAAPLTAQQPVPVPRLHQDRSRLAEQAQALQGGHIA